jgi:hypothetical protein
MLARAASFSLPLEDRKVIWNSNHSTTVEFIEGHGWISLARTGVAAVTVNYRMQMSLN